MTTTYSDNFDTDTVGQLPSGWANKTGTWAVGTNNPVSGSNSFGSTSNADGDVALYTAATAIADMDVSFSMKQTVSSTVPPVMGVVLRSDTANSNNYTIVFGGAVSGQIAALLFKKVSGTFTQIGTQNISLSQAVGDTIRIRATIVGGTISVYVGNGTLPSTASATFNDASVTAAGYPGLYNGKNSQTTSMAVDDFVFANTAGSSTVSDVAVSPSTASVQGGATQQFSATVSGTGSPSQAVSWTATAGSINSSGLFTAPTATGSAQTITITATSSQDGAKSGTATVTVPAAGQQVNNALASNTAGVLFSPYNWDVQASTAKTINAGAYFKTIFGGTTCTLNFDLTGVASPLPEISYRVDRFGPWTTVPVAASVAVNIPSDTSDYANKPGHLLEVLVKSMTETQARWSTQATAVKLTGIILDTGKSISAPPALPLKAIFYGDSITEGVRTVNMTATSDTDRNDAGQGWSLETARILGAEIGNVGFGATGFNVAGSGGVPSLPSTYNYLYAGVARSFATSPDFIVLMEGTNDSSDVTANATTVLNGLLAATTSTKIIVLRPFKDATHATQLQAAVAACSTPARVTYVDTAGWFTSTNSSDNLHPYGVENITHIAPLAAAAIKSALSSSTIASTPTRIFSVTLGNANGAIANRNGLHVNLYATPNGGASNSTDASGMLNGSAQVSLSSGATGFASVLDPTTGEHWAGPVTVS